MTRSNSTGSRCRDPGSPSSAGNHPRAAQFSLFGSILRDDFGPDSDIDVLVEFEPENTPGWQFFGMQDELTRTARASWVDLNTRPTA